MPPKLREVLIIDDDQIANYVNERIVTEMQLAHTITILQNGNEGLDYILKVCGKDHNFCPDLIILDHFMPELNGLELMEKLHENGLIEEMRTVFLLLAIHTDIEDLKKFEELGVQEFTDKPLSKNRLHEAYEKYWANNTARDHS